MHADGYQGNHKLSPDITIVGCWAHMRRKWVDAQTVSGGDERQSAVVEEALKRIGYLFQLEKEWEKLTADERHNMRQEKGKSLADSYFEWCARLNFLPKSAVGKAIHYAYSQRQYLMNVYMDGRAEFSNNRAENSIRPFAIGRKNWLFCASIRGAEASSIIYSIIETAKANGLKAFEYIEWLLETLPNSTTSAIDSMLPWSSAVPARCRMSVLEI